MSTYAEEIRREAEAAPRAALPTVTALLWRAYADGHLSDAEAEALSLTIEARQLSEIVRRGGQTPNPSGTTDGSSASSGPVSAPRKLAVGSRPRTDTSMARRRRWAASGRLPPALACRFTLAEQAALAVIAVEVVKRGDCRLAVGAVAALAGVSETTVRNAVREARQLGLLTVEERRLARYRNETNVVRIVSAEWSAWLRLARKGMPPRHALGAEALPSRQHPSSARGGGCRSAKGTTTGVPYPVNPGGWEPRKGCRQAAGDLTARASRGIVQSGIRGEAMQ